MTSCTSTAKFPISQATPAADITVKTKKQSTPNYLVTITANNLAASERLDPPKKMPSNQPTSPHIPTNLLKFLLQQKMKKDCVSRTLTFLQFQKSKCPSGMRTRNKII